MNQRLKRILLTAVLIGACAALCAGCKKKEETKEAEVIETVEEPEEETEKEPVRVAADQNVVNIMLVGQDRRAVQSKTQRSDSMILVTLNRADQTIDLTSFMRDTYVEIPDWGGNRLNAAYAFGGMELMDATIQQNFGVKIDGNVEVDFYDFVEIIDAVGGVDIEVNSEEISVLNDYVKGVAEELGEQPEDHYVTTAGMQHLDGIQTLSYCRIRYVGNADFERTQRQRRVLQALFTSAKELNTVEILGLLNDTFDLLTTDLTDEDLMNLMIEALDMGVDEFENHNIPEDAGYTSQNIDGMSVLVPDLAACQTLLQEIVGE